MMLAKEERVQARFNYLFSPASFFRLRMPVGRLGTADVDPESASVSTESKETTSDTAKPGRANKIITSVSIDEYHASLATALIPPSSHTAKMV